MLHEISMESMPSSVVEEVNYSQDGVECDSKMCKYSQRLSIVLADHGPVDMVKPLDQTLQMRKC